MITAPGRVQGILIDLISKRKPLGLALQPIFDLGGGSRVVGYELLARPGCSPPDLWQQARTTGLEGELEKLVLAQVPSVLRRVAEDQMLFVNISPATLVEVPWETLANHSLAICLEFVETARANTLDLVDRIQAIRKAGIQIAIDDAGVENANMQAVIDLRPDYTKIANEVVWGARAGGVRERVLTALIEIGIGAGSKVICEGIESPEDLERVKHYGCTLAQGYLLGRPVLVA